MKGGMVWVSIRLGFYIAVKRWNFQLEICDSGRG
jgi:hypothetical protein